MVRGLGMTEGVALARVWLLRTEPGLEPYLELQASIGTSLVDPLIRWTRTDGAHQRIPLSYGKVGQIAGTNKPLLLQRGPRDWLLQPEWAQAEKIESFAGQPLAFRGQVLGVVALFSRKRLEGHDLNWLRVFADHAAVAIANARAFEEIERLKERAELERDYLREAVRSALREGEIVAQSERMKSVLSQVEYVAKTESTVLVLGESGVGKELIAAAIHRMSFRREGPLVRVNCASIPRELFESEFFGHVRGAFSGAFRDRQGRFQLADGGTLFLDEIGEIPLDLQSKLLRVLQEHTFEPVGDDRTRTVDVRVIAATNGNLSLATDQGRFRRDLYYRLSVLPIEVPALRERREDILPLARSFLKTTAARLHVPEPPIDAAAESALLSYDFPGNVRELQNVIERAVVLAPTTHGRLCFDFARGTATSSVPPPQHRFDHTPDGTSAERGVVTRHGTSAERGVVTRQGTSAERGVVTRHEPETSRPPSRDRSNASGDVVSMASIRDLERSNILNALARCDFKVSGGRGAAKMLGMNASTLAYRMKQLGIRRPH
jgi:transcriptional regulator with GAF, ATPase, and Fis domain